MTARKKDDEIEALDRVEITFHDAWYEEGHWLDTEDVVNSAEPCRSVGFFIEADDVYITIAQTLATRQLGHLFHIPRASVVTLERI